MINAYIFRTLPLIVLLAAAATCATAQTKPVPAWSLDTLGHLRQLQHIALDDDYAYQRLAHLTDNIGPRATGSLQAAAAVDYVADEMRKLGLEVTLEKVTSLVGCEEKSVLSSSPIPDKSAVPHRKSLSPPWVLMEWRLLPRESP